jgi:voltage-gated potassium channel
VLFKWHALRHPEVRAYPAMVNRTFDTYIQTFFQRRFLILLVLILSLLVLTPFLDDFVETRILMDAFLTAIFCAIIFAVKSKRSHVIIASFLALPLIISIWSFYFVELTSISLLTRIFGALFLGYAVINILSIVTQSEEVTKETIYAAIVAYMLMALMWAFLYMILELLVPGSFSFPEKGFRAETMRFKYFSFVTITTLGYGDIAPLTNKASALVLVEALVGQVYLVVLVAWLVGMHVSRRSR